MKTNFNREMYVCPKSYYFSHDCSLNSPFPADNKLNGLCCIFSFYLPGPQDGAVRLLAVLQVPAGGEPRQAPHHHPEGRALPAPDGHPGVHVRGRGQRGPGPAARIPQDRGEAQGQGAGRGTTNHQAGVEQQQQQQD